MSAFANHLAYEFKAGMRDRSHLMMNYLFPLIFFVLAGSFMTRLDPSFKDRIIPAMAVFAVMCCYLLSMPAGMVAARDAGILRSYRINGVPSWASLSAPPLSNLGHMILVTAVVCGASVLVFGSPLPGNWLRFGASWFAIAAATAGLGALIAVLSPTSRAATLIAQIVYIPSIMLGGLMTAPGVLPPALARFASVFPASHAMRAFAGTNGWGMSIAVLLVGAVLGFVCAALLYEWDAKNSRPAAQRLLAAVAFAPYIAAAILGL